MKNIIKNAIKRRAYALAFPLVFVASSNAQTSSRNIEDLASSSFNDFNHITLDQISDQEIPAAPVAQREYEFGTKTYNLSMCLNDVSEQDKFRLRYTYYRVKQKVATFYLLDIFPGTPKPVDPHMEGGFTIRMSTEITSGYSPADPSDPVKAYNVKVHNSSMEIERTYDIFTSDPYEKNGKKNCLDLKVILNDELKNKSKN